MENFLNKIKQITNALKAKENRHINKKSKLVKTYYIGEKIHSDLGGPITPIIYNKYKYYIIFLDKKSKYLEINILRLKNEAFNAWLKFKARFKNKFNNANNN